MDIGAIFLLDDFLRNVRFFFPFISRTLPCYFPIGIFKNIFALCFACLIVCSVVLLCFFSVICRFFFFRCFAGSGILFDLSWMKVYFNAWKLGRCISVPHFSLICLCLFIKTTNLDHGCACMHPQFRLMHRRISLLLLHASAVPAVFKMFFFLLLAPLCLLSCCPTWRVPIFLLVKIGKGHMGAAYFKRLFYSFISFLPCSMHLCLCASSLLLPCIYIYSLHFASVN